MKHGRWTRLIPPLFLLTLIGVVAVLTPWNRSDPQARYTKTNIWQAAASPGPLSEAHAFLENNCAACHIPIQGVTANRCIVCHANNQSLLQRQPTAFHADISSCAECHLEHQGRSQRPVTMDHNSLAKIGLRQLEQNTDPASEDRITLRQLHEWLGTGSTRTALLNPHLSAQEMVLDCTTCHQNDDRHFKLFGTNCASCHSATAWTIAEFGHPSSTSMDCAQCHQAPPSHYMMHFNMISKKVAGQPHAQIEQCYKCHQTTSWPDIKGTGWYKHH